MGEEEIPKFDIVEDHEFQVKEKILVIDPNGFDLWEGEIVAIEDGKYSIHYPEFPDDDETVEDTARLLVKNRVNTRIFNNQEASRNAQLPPLESGEEEPFDDNSDEDESEGDYKPAPGETQPGLESGRQTMTDKISPSKNAVIESGLGAHKHTFEAFTIEEAISRPISTKLKCNLWGEDQYSS